LEIRRHANELAGQPWANERRQIGTLTKAHAEIARLKKAQLRPKPTGKKKDPPSSGRKPWATRKWPNIVLFVMPVELTDIAPARRWLGRMKRARVHRAGQGAESFGSSRCCAEWCRRGQFLRASLVTQHGIDIEIL